MTIIHYDNIGKHRRRVVKFVGGALALPEADINEFLGDYDSNWEEAMIQTGGLSPSLTTPMCPGRL